MSSPPIAVPAGPHPPPRTGRVAARGPAGGVGPPGRGRRQGLAAVRGGHGGRPAAVRQGPGLGPARRRPAVPGVPGGAAAECRRHPAGRFSLPRGRAPGPSRIDGRTGRGFRTRRPDRPGRGHRAARHALGRRLLAGPAARRSDRRRPAHAAVGGSGRAAPGRHRAPVATTYCPSWRRSAAAGTPCSQRTGSGCPWSSASRR